MGKSSSNIRSEHIPDFIIEEVKSEDDESPSIQENGQKVNSSGFDMQSFHIKV
jgi:hypothetical protein